MGSGIGVLPGKETATRLEPRSHIVAIQAKLRVYDQPRIEPVPLGFGSGRVIYNRVRLVGGTSAVRATVAAIGALSRYDRPAPSPTDYDDLLTWKWIMTATANPATVDAAVQACIGAATRELRLPTVRTEAARLAEIAEERRTHLR